MVRFLPKRFPRLSDLLVDRKYPDAATLDKILCLAKVYSQRSQVVHRFVPIEFARIVRGIGGDPTNTCHCDAVIKSLFVNPNDSFFVGNTPVARLVLKPSARKLFSTGSQMVELDYGKKSIFTIMIPSLRLRPKVHKRLDIKRPGKPLHKTEQRFMSSIVTNKTLCKCCKKTIVKKPGLCLSCRGCLHKFQTIRSLARSSLRR